MKSIMILSILGVLLFTISHYAISSTKAMESPTARLTIQRGISSIHDENAPTVHYVRSGDTLWGISEKYMVDVAAIRAANPKLGVRPHSFLYVGEKIIIPKPFV